MSSHMSTKQVPRDLVAAAAVDPASAAAIATAGVELVDQRAGANESSFSEQIYI